METLTQKSEVLIQPQSPSLLRQIVDEVDMLDEEGKKNVLKIIKGAKAVAKAKLADKAMEGKFKEMTEEEIWEMVSTNRKKWYEESLNS